MSLARSFIPAFLLLFLLSAAMTALGQDSPADNHLSRVKDLVDRNDIILFWSQNNESDTIFSRQQIYELDLTQSSLSERLVPAPLHTDSLVSGNGQFALATGRFIDDGLEHVVGAWPGMDGSITLMVPDIDSATLSWNQSARLIIPSALANSSYPALHLASGDFYGRGMKDEFVLAYRTPEDSLNLQVYSFREEELVPRLRSTLQDVKITDNSYLQDWQLVTGDFNGDRYEDIALIYVTSTGGTTLVLHANFYTVDENGGLQSRGSAEVFRFSTTTSEFPTSIDVGGASGNFTNSDRLALAAGITMEVSEGQPDTYVILLDITDDLNVIQFSDSTRIIEDRQNENEITPLQLATGDLDGDFDDELVMVTSGGTRIYTVNDRLHPTYKFSRGALSPATFLDPYFLAVADMDGSGREEIIQATVVEETFVGGEQYSQLQIMSVDTALSSTQTKARREREHVISDQRSDRQFAMAVGDFSGKRTWLGSPNHYRRTNILQPSVILYAPPVHYDIINSTVYDLSDCYPEFTCGFSTSYTQTTTTSETVTIEVHSDWGASVGVEATLPGSKTKMTASYGEKFSNSATSTETIRVSAGRAATGDDWIYANLYDIDFYEYPVYEGTKPDPVGYYLVSNPGNVRPLWIESKNDQQLGNVFHPSHETGNILSYPTLESPDMSSLIVDFPEQTVGATGNSFVSLEFNTFSQNSASTSWEAGIALETTIGDEIDFYGIEAGASLSVRGEFNFGENLIQTVSVGEELAMRGDFNHIDSRIGGSATYHVKPYAYWTQSGGLALDYKVSIPEGDNFWTTHYGEKTDLAFSLPWRYDVAKGLPYPGNDPSYRFRSRDIILSDRDPQGGDTVTVAASIRNMGLQEVDPPVNVQFYLGDPGENGSMISATVIDTGIAPRSYLITSFEWIIPGSLSLEDARIYAVIDPDNSITNEVHEDNNKGWAPVRSLGTPTHQEPESELASETTLFPAYPNPFNPATNIQFDLSRPMHVELTVYDILGRRVATLLEAERGTGTHLVPFDASHLSSGVYIYRLSAGDRVLTRKMMLLK